MSEPLRVTVSHTREVPDPLRLERYDRAPELGPSLLFVSGGTALRELSRVLVRYTHNSVHLITPFDSGGSSAKLRQAFRMISVGDMRNRLMALADTRLQGVPGVYQLFKHRLSKRGDAATLERRLDALVRGRDPLMSTIPQPMQQLVRNHLGFFQQAMPDDFDLRGASLGNLVLTGGYLNHRRDIRTAIFLFSRLVRVLGQVRPVVDADLHLAARLQDGSWVAGQHRLTGKEVAPLTQPIAELHLSAERDRYQPAEAQIDDDTRALIRQAELITYPMGSFYSSVLACLLPGGMGEAIAAAGCPRVYVPSCGVDPEQLGLSVAASVGRLLEVLGRDFDRPPPTSALLNFVVVDSESGVYPEGLDLEAIRRLGVAVIDAPLVTAESAPMLDPLRLAQLLLSLT